MAGKSVILGGLPAEPAHWAGLHLLANTGAIDTETLKKLGAYTILPRNGDLESPLSAALFGVDGMMTVHTHRPQTARFVRDASAIVSLRDWYCVEPPLQAHYFQGTAAVRDHGKIVWMG